MVLSDDLFCLLVKHAIIQLLLTSEAVHQAIRI